MASNDYKYKRSFTVLAVVVACFAVLWPKIFYPMIQSVISPLDSEDEGMPENLPTLNFQKLIHPQVHESLGEERPLDKSSKDGFKVWIHPSVRQAVKPHSRNGGALNIFVPVYSIGIILFFAYTALKMMIRKPDDENSNFIKVLPQPDQVCKYINLEEKEIKKKDILQERKAQRALQQYGKDKVITALKTIILEMEECKENFVEFDDLVSKINLEPDDDAKDQQQNTHGDDVENFI